MPGLRIELEVKKVEEQLSRIRPSREQNIKPYLRTKWATTATDLRQAVQDYRPDILHFAGHGTGQEGIILEDYQGNPRHLPSSVLAKLCEMHSDHIECVVLNACYSAHQAEAIIEHVDFVVGMQAAIGDPEARVYSAAFYDSLAGGDDIETSHRHACWELEALFPHDSDISKYSRRHANASGSVPQSLPAYRIPLLITRPKAAKVSRWRPLHADNQEPGNEGSAKRIAELEHRCRAASQISLLRASEKLPGDGRHIITRDDSGPDLQAFLASDRPILAVLGGSGTGKSTLLYQFATRTSVNLAFEKAASYVSLFYDAHQLLTDPTVPGRIARDLGSTEGELDDQLNNLGSDLATTRQCLLIIVDGLNEVPSPAPLQIKAAVEALATKTHRNIKFIFSCRRVFWEAFVEPVENLPRELYFSGTGFRLGPFSDDECRMAFRGYRRIYAFIGQYDSLKSVFREKIRDPLMLRMVAESYQGQELPNFAPAVLVFSEYERILQSRLRGTLAFEYLSILVRQKINKARKGEDDSDSFDIEEIIAGENGHYLTAATGNASNPLIILEDEGVITKVDESTGAFRFTYDRFMEYILGKNMLAMKDIPTLESYVSWIESEVEFWSTKHFCFLQALKSEVVRQFILGTRTDLDLLSQCAVNRLFRGGGLARSFFEGVLREIVFESKRDIVTELQRCFSQADEAIALLVRVASDASAVKPVLLQALFSDRRELILRSLIGLSKMDRLLDARRIGSTVLKHVEDQRAQGIQISSMKSLIYFSSYLFSVADKAKYDPLEEIADFWRAILLRFKKNKSTFIEKLSLALCQCIQDEGELFYGEGFTDHGILYPWLAMDERVRCAAYALSDIIQRGNLTIGHAEVLQFFASARREWQGQSSERQPGDLHAYQLEYRIAQWLLIRQSATQFPTVVRILDRFTSSDDWFLLDFALTVMARIIRLVVRDDRELVRIGFDSMIRWDRRFERDFDEYYRVLSSEDPLAVNSVPMAMTASVDAEFFSPKEGPVASLQVELESDDSKRVQMALLALRTLVRRGHCNIRAAIRTLQVVIAQPSPSNDTERWLDSILRDLYLNQPRATENFLLDLKIGGERATRIRGKSALQDVVGASHNGEPLYKALLLRSQSRLDCLGRWHQILLASAGLSEFCRELVSHLVDQIDAESTSSLNH